MKTVKCVQWLVKKALEKGKACIKRKKIKVYEAEVYKESFELRHYGTLTLVVDLNTKEITRLGGWSRTDRDSINNALFVLGVNCKVKLSDGVIEVASK